MANSRKTVRMDDAKWTVVASGAIALILAGFGGGIAWLVVVQGDPTNHLRIWTPVAFASLGAVVIGAVLLLSCFCGLPFRLTKRATPAPVIMHLHPPPGCHVVFENNVLRFPIIEDNAE
jgi:hypothetical protein